MLRTFSGRMCLGLDIIDQVLLRVVFMSCLTYFWVKWRFGVSCLGQYDARWYIHMRHVSEIQGPLCRYGCPDIMRDELSLVLTRLPVHKRQNVIMPCKDVDDAAVPGGDNLVFQEQSYFTLDAKQGDTICLGADGQGCGTVVQDHKVGS